MPPDTLLNRVSQILDQSGLRQGTLFHEDSVTHMLRHEIAAGQHATVYRPLLCLVLQGAKDVETSAKILTVRTGQSLIVSHAVPVLSRITKPPERARCRRCRRRVSARSEPAALGSNLRWLTFTERLASW